MNAPKKKALFLIFFAGCSFFVSGCQSKDAVVAADYFAMDTCFSVRLHGTDTALADCKTEIQNILNDLNVLLDCHAESSTVSMLSHMGNCQNHTLAEIITETQTLEQRFGNAVQVSCRPLTSLWNIGGKNVTVPSQSRIADALERIDDTKIAVDADNVALPIGMALDFGAVAKGYALDQIAMNLSESPSLSYGVVSASSAVLLYGAKPENQPFSVEITNPNAEGMLGTLTIPSDSSDFQAYVATSGNAERFSEINGETYGHIFDLSTGCPAESDFASVTVVTDSGLKADFLSTLIFIEGKEHIDTHCAAEDYLVLAVDKNGQIYQSDTLEFEVKP